jgi:hypothetical protein
MKCFMTGVDEMSTTLVLIILGGLLAAALFVVSQWKRYRIRHTGRLVMAKVIQVNSWDETSLDRGISGHVWAGGSWQYELIAEWTDPRTGKTARIPSGIRDGLPGYQQGEYLPAYLSPKGNYLELS